MRVFNWLLGGLLTLAVAAIAVGLMLPSQLQLSRATVIQAPVERVYGVISDVRRFEDFSPWRAPGDGTDYSYPGATSGVGARLEWSSTRSEIGSGSLEITATLEDRRIEMRVDYAGARRPVENWLQLRPVDNGTRVEWSVEADFGWDLLGRYTGVLFTDTIGAQYERGLERLKRLIEDGLPAGAGGSA